jgi:trigger factor
MRHEIMDRLIAETPFDLPADVVARQEQTTLQRLTMQLKQEGMSDNEIRARQAEIRANARESALRGLKEYFLLEQIADAEGIEVEEKDFEEEIEAMAARSDESPRRVRARIQKDKMLDALGSQILERKTLDRIFESVQYQEVPLVEEEVAVETLDQTATAAPPESERESESAPESEPEPASETPGAESAVEAVAGAGAAPGADEGGSDG